MKKRVIILSLTAVAVLSFITLSIAFFKSGVVTYAYNEAVAFLSGVDRNNKVIVGGDRKTTLYTFADKAEMTISNRIEGKEDYEIDSLKIAVSGGNTKHFAAALNDWIELYYYHGGKLFIATKDKFYVFDYLNYPPEKYNLLADAKANWLPAYNEKEFAEEYPDYGSFGWEYGWASKKERAKAHHPNLVK